MDATEREERLEEQRRRWDEVAGGWERWWAWIEEATRGVNERLLELAGVRPGQRVLDVATGLGEPAISAARRVGPGGSVLGIDLADGMLDRARGRLRAEGLANVELERRDVQRLGLAGEGFEAGLCRFGLMLVDDPLGAAREIRAALAPGARLAAAVWGPPAAAPFFELPARAMEEELGLAPLAEPALEGEPAPTRLGEPRLLATVLERAGFVDVQVEEASVAFRFSSATRFLALLEDISTRLRQGLAGADPALRARLEARLRELLAPHTAGDGTLLLANAVLLARGTVPAHADTER